MYLKSRTSIAVAAAATVLALGCRGGASGAREPLPDTTGPAEPLRVRAPLFIPGEYMTWELTWRGIEGGKSQLIVGEPGEVDGQRAIIVRSETRSDGLLAMFRHVRDDLTTTVALATSLPLSNHGEFEFGKRNAKLRASKVDIAFGPGQYAIDYERRGKPVRKWTQKVPDGEVVYDTHAAMGALRAWDPEPGNKVYFLAVSGRRLYRVELLFVGRRTKKIGLGSYAAMEFEGTGQRLMRSLSPDKKRKPRRFTMWMSDDANRVPFLVEARTEYGAVKVELTGYERGTGRVPVAVR